MSVAWAGAAAAVALAVTGCAGPGQSGGGLAPEEPPMILPTSDATPSASPAAETGGGYAECADASSAALTAVNASIAAHDGPYPGLQLEGLETMWDEDQRVWTLAGVIGPVGVDPESTEGTERRVALWATDQDPTRDDFAGTLWSAVNGSDMVSAAPQLGSFPPLTMDGPGPAGLWCSDLYPEAAGGSGG